MIRVAYHVNRRVCWAWPNLPGASKSAENRIGRRCVVLRGVPPDSLLPGRRWTAAPIEWTGLGADAIASDAGKGLILCALALLHLRRRLGDRRPEHPPFANAPLKHYLKMPVYYRLLIGRFIPEDIDQLLYLDADMYALSQRFVMRRRRIELAHARCAAERPTLQTPMLQRQ